MHPDFSSPTWDLIQAGSKDASDSDNASSSTLQPQSAANIAYVCSAIDSIAEDLKLQEDNKQLVFGAEKSIHHYNKLKHNLTLLTSALHQFWLDIWWVSIRKVGTCGMADG